jgi:hypothetical protein
VRAIAKVRARPSLGAPALGPHSEYALAGVEIDVRDARCSGRLEDEADQHAARLDARPAGATGPITSSAAERRPLVERKDESAAFQ